jgi:hypothetical protein
MVLGNQHPEPIFQQSVGEAQRWNNVGRAGFQVDGAGNQQRSCNQNPYRGPDKDPIEMN